MLAQILLASFTGSILALLAGSLLLWRENLIRRFSLTLVSFAVGSLIGVVFFDLLPEAVAEADFEAIAPAVVAGIAIAFLTERFLNWYHCHEPGQCDVHQAPLSMVLVGDGIHNFIDGVAIALSFAAGTSVGIATTVAVFFHEVPQEIGDFGVLLHAGWKKSRVFLFNLMTSLLTFSGAMAGYLFLPWIGAYLPFLLAFTAGAFLYIAISDLLPELKHRNGADFEHLFAMGLGLAVIWTVGVYLPE